ncbi:MAG: hypothetical protein AAFP93_01315, partial [Bacteroidota bacterium]
IDMGQLVEAYKYLKAAIDSNEMSGLSYDQLTRETVVPVLQKRIDSHKKVALKGIDYAYYLIIHHYEEFAKAGIELGKPQTEYLNDFKTSVQNREANEIARYLLESLQQELRSQAVDDKQVTVQEDSKSTS